MTNINIKGTEYSVTFNMGAMHKLAGLLGVKKIADIEKGLEDASELDATAIVLYSGVYGYYHYELKQAVPNNITLDGITTDLGSLDSTLFGEKMIEVFSMIYTKQEAEGEKKSEAIAA